MPGPPHWLGWRGWISPSFYDFFIEYHAKFHQFYRAILWFILFNFSPQVPGPPHWLGWRGWISPSWRSSPTRCRRPWAPRDTFSSLTIMGSWPCTLSWKYNTFTSRSVTFFFIYIAIYFYFFFFFFIFFEGNLT